MRCVQVTGSHVVPLRRPVDGGVVLNVKLLHTQTDNSASLYLDTFCFTLKDEKPRFLHWKLAPQQVWIDGPHRESQPNSCLFNS